MNCLTIFDYPNVPHTHRHGPIGYSDYDSYRDWLRDEFSFRCVFCLRREQWDRRVSTFHIDHFVPQHAARDKALEYENLLYVCASCNSLKGDQEVPSPCVFNYGECLRVLDDGRIQALNLTGQIVVRLLALDTPDATKYRKLILDTIKVLMGNDDRSTYREWVRFPEDLPDLSRKKPPKGNTRPDGVANSWFAKKARGELPEAY